MFTKLIKTTTKILSITQHKPKKQIIITMKLKTLELNKSITINNIYLTITHVHQNNFTTNVSSKTLTITTLNNLTHNNKINIKHSVKLDNHINKHIILNHIDNINIINSFEQINST